ncbi:MAG TPA: hypothetical protein DCZ43_03360 [candidate division Zixibacteria bacterium]|nr:hypothetical protein [candidate division Zixibacteria bacterium]
MDLLVKSVWSLKKNIYRQLVKSGLFDRLDIDMFDSSHYYARYEIELFISIGIYAVLWRE